MDDKKTFIEAINELGSRIKTYFKDKNIEDEKNTKTIKNSLTHVQAAISDVRKAVESNNNKKLEKSIENLTKVLKEKELSVDFKMPEVNVPEPKVEVLKESKEAKETNELLKKVLQSMLRKEADNSVYVQNRRPQEAIPVKLTDKSSKRFYDAVMMAVTSAANSGSGGGVGGDVNINQIGGTSTSVNDGVADNGTLRVTQANDVPIMAKGAQAEGVAATQNPVLIAGEDPDGNVKKLQTAPDGDLVVHQHAAQVSLPDGVSNTEYIPVNQNDVGFMATPTFPYNYNGLTWDRLRGDATNGLLVNLGANNDVTVSGVATEAKQDSLITLLSAVDFATDSTLNSILSKIIAAPATEAKQDTIISLLGNSGTGTSSSVADSATSVTLLSSNSSRKGATFYNDSTATLYLKCGATASSTSFTVVMAARSYYELPFKYTGVIDGIWASAAGGYVRITEFT